MKVGRNSLLAHNLSPERQMNRVLVGLDEKISTTSPMLAKQMSVQLEEKDYFFKYILSVGLSISPGYLWEMCLSITAFLVC